MPEVDKNNSSVHYVELLSHSLMAASDSLWLFEKKNAS